MEPKPRHSENKEIPEIFEQVVRAPVYKSLRPDNVQIIDDAGYPLPLARVYLTGSDYMEKSADTSRNPEEIMYGGGKKKKGEDAVTAALRELREEFQYPTFVIGTGDPIQRKLSIFLPATRETINRDEEMVAVYLCDVVPPVGVNPQDKVGRTLTLSPAEVDVMFSENQLNNHNPLVTSLQFFFDDPGNAINENIDGDPNDVLYFRNYILNHGYWFELVNRLKVLQRVLRRDSEVTTNLDPNILMQMEGILMNCKEGEGDAARFLTYEEFMQKGGMAYRGEGGLKVLVNGLGELLNMAELEDSLFREHYLKTYNEIYFEQILTYEKTDIQKYFLDAIGFVSLSERTPHAIEQFQDLNPLVADYLNELAGILNVPNRGIDFYSNLSARIYELQKNPEEYIATSTALKERIFGSVEQYKHSMKTVQDLILVIHRHLRDSFVRLGDAGYQMNDEQNYDRFFVEQDLPDMLQILLTGQHRGMPVPRDRQYQVIRHLMLGYISSINMRWYTNRLNQRPPVLETLDYVKAVSPFVEVGGTFMRWRSEYSKKEYYSFIRKIIERSRAYEIYDVHRNTLIPDAQNPEEGVQAVEVLLSRIIQDNLTKKKKVKISHIKGHPAFVEVMRRLEQYYQEKGLELDWNHEGSGADYNLNDVYWAKSVFFVDDIPMEVAMCARECDFEEKKRLDPEFNLRRLFAYGSGEKNKSKMSVVDILALPFRAEMLRNFYLAEEKRKKEKKAT